MEGKGRRRKLEQGRRLAKVGPGSRYEPWNVLSHKLCAPSLACDKNL